MTRFNPNPESYPFRTDIQALRGLAILLVVLHHSELVSFLGAGYLGVDIFFVVSGYLITGIVAKGIRQGTFSFSGFYFRRAKRLLPAAYVTLLATTLLSSLFLTRPEMRDYIWQLLGAVTFTGNIALWMQTGYFEGAAELKPLLHVWSLSIEEQYYLLLPAALVFTPRRFWPAGAFAVLVLSLTLCLALVAVKPSATFYLLPTRAWELALGSLGALAPAGWYQGWGVARLFWPALAALLAVPFFPTGAPHPGLDVLIVCLATLIVILRRHPVLDRSVSVRGLARLGDISYSLYLVHWPVLAFAANAWVSPTPAVVRLGLVLVALVLSYALFRWVERPVRRAAIPCNRTSIMVALGSSAVLMLTGLWVYHAGSGGVGPDYTDIRRANLGLNAVCSYGDRFAPKPACQTSDLPRILVWGSSFAMHLVEGITASTNLGLAQATKSGCSPLVDIPSEGGCLSFNQSVLEYLANAVSVEVVVLSGFPNQRLAVDPLLAAVGRNADGSPGVPAEQGRGENILVRSLSATIAAIRALGKRVVLVGPPPGSGFDVGRCLELKADGKAVFGADSRSCVISEARYRTFLAGVLALLDRVADEADVPVIRLDDFLCQKGSCAAEIHGHFLYRDGGHLTYDGSRLLGQEMGLGGRIMEVAR